MNKDLIMSGKLNHLDLMDSVPFVLNEIINQYTSFKAAKKDIHVTHLDNNDESHFYYLVLTWIYPQGDPKVLEEEICDQIAYQSTQVYRKLETWIQRFCDHQNNCEQPWTQVHHYHDHAIWANEGDSIELHCDDNHLYITFHFSGQW